MQERYKIYRYETKAIDTGEDIHYFALMDQARAEEVFCFGPEDHAIRTTLEMVAEYLNELEE